MSRRRKRRSHKAGMEYQDVELNLMPFIDVFSILNTFLLFSAVFLSVGIIKVQVPYFSNAATPPTKAKRALEVKVDMEKEKIILITSFTAPPTDERKQEYDPSDMGIEMMHKRLVEIRTQNPDTDLVTFFCDDDVTYAELTKVLDAIKLRQDGDPVFKVAASSDSEEVNENDNERQYEDAFLFPKIVMGSVIL